MELKCIECQLKCKRSQLIRFIIFVFFFLFLPFVRFGCKRLGHIRDTEDTFGLQLSRKYLLFKFSSYINFCCLFFFLFSSWFVVLPAYSIQSRKKIEWRRKKKGKKRKESHVFRYSRAWRLFLWQDFVCFFLFHLFFICSFLWNGKMSLKDNRGIGYKLQI